MDHPARLTRRVRAIHLSLRVSVMWLAIGGPLGCITPPRFRAPGLLTGSPPSVLYAWVVEDCRQVGPSSGPTPENEVYSAAQHRVRLSAAISETIAWQIVLSSSGPPAGPYTINISDLRSSAATLDSRSCVTIYHAQCVPIEHYESWYPRHAGQSATPRLFADVLVPWEAPRGGGPVSLDGTRNEIVWVDLAVPPTAEPGEYSGKIEINKVGQQRAEFTCDLKLSVLPIALPADRSLPMVCGVDPRDLLVEQLRWDRGPARDVRLLSDAPNHQAAIRLINSVMQNLHSHRLTPILWGSFPKFHPSGDRGVEIDWAPYDQLVSGWLDGTAFTDNVGLSRWPIPASWDHPNPDVQSGFETPRYARLLAAYLSACRAHFAERGWLDKAFVRLAPPEELTRESLERVKRLSGILRQSEASLPFMAHLPARSLRGLGYYNAPQMELSNISIWAPPAMWFEPEPMARERALGRQTWFSPDRPPYSGSLSIEAPPADAQLLAWQAYRYECDGVWIEQAADFGATPFEPDKTSGSSHRWLVYPGAQFGLPEQAVGSIRLKRLRRGLQDYEFLRLLERHGKSLLARTMAEQVVRRACTDAALDHLLDTRPEGWLLEPATLSLARELLVQELANQFAPGSTGRNDQITNLARWGRLMSGATRVTPTIEGARLQMVQDELRAKILLSVSNNSAQHVTGRWQLPAPPLGWTQIAPVDVSVPPTSRAVETMDLSLAALGSNTAGVFPFQLSLETDRFGAYTTTARLAVAACPFMDEPVRIDGDLSDWVVAANNVAGDFRLCRGRRSSFAGGPEDVPTCATQASFCQDRRNLYVGVRCLLPDGEAPVWQADNSVPIDGVTPWGQDVVEILLNPDNIVQGASSDIFVVQVKPNGFVSTRHGCRTEPPIGPSDVWNCGAKVRVNVGKQEWVIELSLPLESLGRGAADNRIWGLNVTRLDARRGEYSSWSAAPRNCYSTQSMGNLLILRP